MSGYTKLFASIVSSTVWREDDKTRIVWITMLAMRDRYHVVEASIPGLADLARVSLADCEAAISKLSSPDPYSRTEEFEGRRIEKVDGGWVILNGEKYKKKMDAQDRAEKNKEYCRRYRQKQRELGKTNPQKRQIADRNSILSQQQKPVVTEKTAQAEAEEEAEASSASASGAEAEEAIPSDAVRTIHQQVQNLKAKFQMP